MPIEVESFHFRSRQMRTRFPFQYGIASMTELPHVFLQLETGIDGRAATGLASEGLPPKWFTKDPTTRFEEDLPLMLEALNTAAQAVAEVGSANSVFELWRKLYQRQDAWARGRQVPPLLAHLGTALVERALIDGFCRASAKSFATALHDNDFGIELGELHPELAGSAPSDWLPATPQDSLIARHTIGLGDPLSDADIPAAERCDDGLPQALADAIDRYGLTHFKMKLCGKLEVDLPRLRAVAALLAERVPAYRFTLDGNEQYADLAAFREHWETFLADPQLKDFLSAEHLLFVEQPIHRDHALEKSVAEGFERWPAAPAMIIDESDAELDSLRRALDLGYCGTSHKNCKGVFKGIANACLLEQKRRGDPDGGPWLLSGEDLANVGPVALLNDLAVMAAIGVGHVERNGHHYFAGLSMYPDALQDTVCATHPDLYATSDKGFAALQISGGKIELGSVNEAPFGCGMDLSANNLDALGAERVDPG